MKIIFNKQTLLAVALMMSGLIACGDDSDAISPTDGGVDVDSNTDSDTQDGGQMDDLGYVFDDDKGESSVHHSGQTTRNILMLTLLSEMTRIDQIAVDGGNKPEAGSVFTFLNSFVEGKAKSEHGEMAVVIPGVDNACQAKLSELGDSNLLDKIAGNDSKTDHKVWNEAGNFKGYESLGISAHPKSSIDTPTGLIKALLNTFDAEVQERFAARAAGETTPLYITSNGYDLRAFTAAFLESAINYSQATDDYLDDDIDDKGLLSSNDGLRDGSNDTAMEHTWDEGFGYFGSSKSGLGNADIDKDGCLDVFNEINFGPALFAEQRDSNAEETTEFKANAFDAFVAGRKLIGMVEGNLAGEDLLTLKSHRDDAIKAWEKARAATAIHYINAIVTELDSCDENEDFNMRATDWSSLKGLALGFQFNPRSSLSDEELATMHAQLGDSPAACNSDKDKAIAGFDALRTLIASTFSFSDKNIASW